MKTYSFDEFRDEEYGILVLEVVQQSDDVLVVQSVKDLYLFLCYALQLSPRYLLGFIQLDSF